MNAPPSNGLFWLVFQKILQGDENTAANAGRTLHLAGAIVTLRSNDLAIWLAAQQTLLAGVDSTHKDNQRLARHAKRVALYLIAVSAYVMGSRS